MVRVARPRKPKVEFPPERYVLLQDYRSRWDGVLARVCAGPHLERSVSPGEIAVFTPTGAEVPYEITEGAEGRERVKTIKALVYRRTSTRFHRTLPPMAVPPAAPRPDEAPVTDLATAVQRTTT